MNLISTKTIKSICEHLPEKMAANAGVMTLASALWIYK